MATTQKKHVVFTDLDGTLLDADQTLSKRNRATLVDLESRGVMRVVITGRSLLSCDRVIDGAFPIDVLVTSSGAGIFNHSPRRLLHAFGLSASEIETAVGVLQQLDMDFMVHAPVPDNHRFQWYRAETRNPDFDRRLSLYEGHHEPLDLTDPLPQSGAQLLAICKAASAEAQHETLRRYLPEHNVIRTTSPLDHESTWFEIFPKTVGKAQAAQWICTHLDLAAERALAIGNDFNDVDMLRWAPVAHVVSNSPSALTQEFHTVADHQDAGFTEAVNLWLDQIA
ncbi:MAG: HAD family phosphatase [Gammaproteobacteria bacterium]|nr:HAD family phosphatase [Gammaproteobacteria bacterium]